MEELGETDLTLTRVVFEYKPFTTCCVLINNLTLTRVVFEYF